MNPRNSKKERVSIDVIEQTPEFRNLTPKQRLFVQTYIASGYDAVFATRTAYNCRDEEHARIMSYPLLESKRILIVLNMHFANDPREEWIDQIRRAIVSKRVTTAQVAAIKLLGQAQGFTGGLPSPGNPPPKPSKPKPEKTKNPKKNSKKTVESKSSSPQDPYKW